MSGPVTLSDGASDPTRSGEVPCPELSVTPAREATVGTMTVRRALPQRGRRTVGAWCFADHMGPAEPAPADAQRPSGIGPHPHTGLHTVTWLTSGSLLHRDSLGSEQPIRPGQLNLMTAGAGVSHSEESISSSRDPLEGVQLWVAQPEATRHGPAAFEHHGELPRAELDAATATVLVGDFAGARSTARTDTDLMGAQLDVRGPTTIGLDERFEYAIVVTHGAVGVSSHACRSPELAVAADHVAGPTDPVGPGNLVYLAPGHDELELVPAGPTRLLLLGGTPFESPILMWWNFVVRNRAEAEAATRDWNSGTDRFGDPGSPLDRIAAPPTPWGA